MSSLRSFFRVVGAVTENCGTVCCRRFAVEFWYSSCFDTDKSSAFKLEGCRFQAATVIWLYIKACYERAGYREL